MPVFDGRRVSAEWHIVLTAARAAGVRFKLNSGQRTMRDQARLFRQNMVRPGVPKRGRPLTAVPNPRAPHIRVGRPDHALDIDALDGGAERFDRWCTGGWGFPLDNTVAGEAWHKEIRGGPAALRRFASKLDGVGDVGLTKNERRTLSLIGELRERPSTDERRSAIRRARRALRGYRARIRAAAAVSGWGRSDRRRRYLALGKAL